MPVEVTGLEAAVELSAIQSNSFARHDDGTVSSWGRGSGLGNGSADNADSASPVATALVGVTSLLRESCALLSTGEMQCWGRTPDFLPFSIQATSNLVAGANRMSWGLGTESHLCIANTDGAVFCRGTNFCGVLGLGEMTTMNPSLTALSNVTGAVELVCSPSYCLARQQDGALMFWGTLVPEKCEDDLIIDAYVPTALSIPGLTVDSMAIGNGHACLATDDERIYCWGSNQDAALGNGTTQPGETLLPTQVPGL